MINPAHLSRGACYPTEQKTTMRMGTFSELGSAQPLSSFRIGKIQNLLKSEKRQFLRKWLFSQKLIVKKLSTGTCTGVNHFFYYTIDRDILH